MVQQHVGRPFVTGEQHVGELAQLAAAKAKVSMAMMAAIRDALRGLKDEPRKLGVDLDDNTVGLNGSMLMVSVNGSAVVL